MRIIADGFFFSQIGDFCEFIGENIRFKDQTNKFEYDFNFCGGFTKSLKVCACGPCGACGGIVGIFLFSLTLFFLIRGARGAIFV